MKIKNLSKSILAVALTVSMTACNDEVMSVVQEVPDYYISIEEAQKDLMEVLSVVDGNNSRTSTSRSINNVYTKNFSDNSSRSNNGLDVHIFNFSDDQGFAIMSTDRRVPSLLALANNGNLNENDTIDNPGLKIFLTSIGGPGDLPIPETFEKLDPFDPGDPTPAYMTWTTDVACPNGLCSVKWGQRDPYNLYCPVIRDTVCPTGCVATAVAQLMAVYEYPDSYSKYNFNWPEMKLTTKNIATTVGADNVARLMQQLGLWENLDIHYAPTGSSSYSEYIPGVLESFGYSDGGTLKYYNIEDVISEINANHPVLADGVAAAGGHEWLIHGLMTRTKIDQAHDENGNLIPVRSTKYYYVQCNWGWDGKGDGYYLSDAFDTSNGPVYNDNSTDDNLTHSTTHDAGRHNFRNIRIITGIRK